MHELIQSLKTDKGRLSIVTDGIGGIPLQPSKQTELKRR